jgi:pilus assembly protein CpaB
MKWTISLLILLGIIASFCVILLVNAFRVNSSLRAGRGDVPVILAARDIPAMSVLTSDMIEVSSAPIKEAPVGYYSGTTQVVGKILSMPIVKGQALTKTCFISDGTGAQLAAALPAGMRAVSCGLSSQSISGGLLYPGCVVDVLASFKLTGGSRDMESKGEALSTTMLHAVQVLAIAGESVVSKPEMAGENDSPSLRGNQRLTVTLLVNPKQAEALQLALENGSISLAMRNPLDKSPVSAEATVLSRGKLTRLGALLGATVSSSVPSGNGADLAGDLPEAAAVTDAEWQTNEPSHWGVTVIRGNKVAEEEFKDDAVVAN